MANFAQGGFSGGFARGRSLKLQKEALEADKLKQRQDRLRSAIDGSEKATIDGVTAATELITELAKAGATEDAQEAAKQGEMLLAPHATLLDEIRTRAILSAKNPQEKELAESLPSGPDFVQRHIGQFQQALALGTSQSATGVAQGKVDAALLISGKESLDEQDARKLAGLGENLT